MEKKYEEWRKKYDLDVIWLDGDLNADTIFSVWIPLKMCLQTSTTYPYSTHGIKEKPYKSNPYLPNIIKNIDAYLPYDEWEELYIFASLAMTKANVMRLPLKGRGMQKGRTDFFDQMPKTLYECFEEGSLHKYFVDTQVDKWIRDENLVMFFENENISKQFINPLISRMNAYEFEWLEDKNEIVEMLSNYNRILKKRMCSEFI